MIGAAVLAAAAVVTGTWSGSYTLPRGTEATAISVEVNRGIATVTLGSGHASDLRVAVSTTGARLRFRIPGRPAWIAFDGKLRRRVVTGTVRQGTLRGTFRLVRGAPIAARETGLYELADGRHFVLWDGFANRLAADLGSGEIHGLRRTGRGVYAIGSGLTDLRGVGTARVDGSQLAWAPAAQPAVTGRRIRILQEEVRVPSAPGSLACTLSRPARPGPMAAVAMVHGSGIAPRGIVGLYTGVFLDSGVAVLACDKRGNGQSSGPYPGERATVAAVDRYARDAEAQARFLAAQPEIDPQRVGLGPNSQGGWIAPLAASREPAIRWLLMLVPPTITVDENDAYEELTTQGATVPARSPAEIDAEVLSRGPGGFDPLPVIRALRIPALWIFAALDQNVATNLSVARLDPIAREPGRDFTYVVLPRANHSLLETEHGLNEETARSHQMARDLFPTMRAWLRAHGL
jgi:alpha-beta hydrolase superfamily lysophospholipase